MKVKSIVENPFREETQAGKLIVEIADKILWDSEMSEGTEIYDVGGGGLLVELINRGVGVTSLNIVEEGIKLELWRQVKEGILKIRELEKEMEKLEEKGIDLYIEEEGGVYKELLLYNQLGVRRYARYKEGKSIGVTPSYKNEVKYKSLLYRLSTLEGRLEKKIGVEERGELENIVKREGNKRIYIELEEEEEELIKQIENEGLLESKEARELKIYVLSSRKQERADKIYVLENQTRRRTRRRRKYINVYEGKKEEKVEDTKFI